jgi:hypothetical protein
MQRGKTAFGAEFIQRGEKRVAGVQTIGNLAAGRGGSRWRGNRADEAAKRLFNEQAERFPLAAGLLLGFQQKALIDVHRRLHAFKVNAPTGSVNYSRPAQAPANEWSDTLYGLRTP